MYYRRRARVNALSALFIVAIALVPWFMMAWVTMLVCGNLHLAGFPVPAIGFGVAFGIVAPLQFSIGVGLVIRAILGD